MSKTDPSDLLPEEIMLVIDKMLAAIKQRMVEEFNVILQDPYVRKDEQFKNDAMRQRYTVLVLRNRLKWLIGDNE
ncbi:MAG: hypothetical protein WED04_12515 [Promethearchaeati archaeon SRVP18_Atabeyarchaeia-1]